MKKLLLSFAAGLILLSSGCAPAPKAEGCDCIDLKEEMPTVMNFGRKVKPEHVTAFRESFEKCRVETLKEPGCLEYAMYQSYEDSTVFFITEMWANKDAHRNHGTLDHLKVHIEEIRGMAESYGKRIEVYVCPHVNEDFLK